MERSEIRDLLNHLQSLEQEYSLSSSDNDELSVPASSAETTVSGSNYLSIRDDLDESDDDGYESYSDEESISEEDYSDSEYSEEEVESKKDVIQSVNGLHLSRAASIIAMSNMKKLNGSSSSLGGIVVPPPQRFYTRSTSAVCQQSVQFIHQEKTKTSPSLCPKPKDVMIRILNEQNVHLPNHSFNTVANYFVANGDTTTLNMIELSRAIRAGDIAAIRRIREAGNSLQVANKFGESIFHATAKQGRLEVMKYLVSQGASPLVHCDTGRNPLHDACWTTSPNFAFIRWMLQRYPDLLFISDSRNFTPLDYVPRDAYPNWQEFLESHRGLLLPKFLHKESP